MGGRLRALVPEDRATLESDPSADTRAKQRAGTERSCPFGFGPLFWRESEKLNLCRRSIPAMRDGFLNGLAVEVLTIRAPGMAGSGRLRNRPVEGFGLHDFRLAGELFVGGVRERLVFVE